VLRKVVLGLLLLAGLASVGGCFFSGEQTTSGPAGANVSPDATASLAAPTSAPVTADPTLTAAQPPVVSPSATPFDFTQDELRTGSVEPPVEIATATPTADLPVAPVLAARAPDFTLTDLNGDEVTLGELRGQVVLLNFWATW
jgi:hypothetical protein